MVSKLNISRFTVQMQKDKHQEADVENTIAIFGSTLGYDNLEVCSGGPPAKPGGLSQSDMMASFLLTADISPLFPYINAIARRAELYRQPRFIRFLFENHTWVLYPDRGLVSPVDDRRQALSLVERLIAFLKNTALKHDRIVPNYRVCRRVSVVDILKLLPKTNCGQCGYASCMAFAASLTLKEALPTQCPHMGFPVAEQALYPVYDGEGNLASTVVIDVDTTKMRLKDPEAGSSQEMHPEERPSSDKQTVSSANSALPAPLSTRELEVLRILACGASNKDISRKLAISPHTVKSHVIHIFNKLGVNDRTQAAVWAARHDLI
jgi:DNA-binding CsgD family transcriptional regulator/ArsR family metal-binding transcriptional regulator